MWWGIRTESGVGMEGVMGVRTRALYRFTDPIQYV